MSFLSKLIQGFTTKPSLHYQLDALGHNVKATEMVTGAKAKRAAAQQAADAEAAANQARQEAEAQAAETARQSAAYQQSLLNIQNNVNALQSANEAAVPDASNIVTGGQQAIGSLKKKKAQTSVAATLGINI